MSRVYLDNAASTPIAPEIIECKIYNGMKADIFALGVVLFYIVIGKLPFEQAYIQDKDYKLIIIDKIDEFWEENNGD